MSSHGGPTLVFSELDDVVEAMDLSDLSGGHPSLSEIARETPEHQKTVMWFPPADEREAIMASLHMSLRPEQAGTPLDAARGVERFGTSLDALRRAEPLGTSLDALRRAEEREMRNRVIMEDIRDICDGNLPRLSREDESPHTQFQQTISRHEDIICLHQEGSHARSYFLFIEPSGKKLTVVKTRDHVVLNDAVLMTVKDFASIQTMSYTMGDCIGCKIQDDATPLNIPSASIPLILAAIQRV